MKHAVDDVGFRRCSAAFRRLCVETEIIDVDVKDVISAAFRRLCVETDYLKMVDNYDHQPPSGGCVLKPPLSAGLCRV